MIPHAHACSRIALYNGAYMEHEGVSEIYKFQFRGLPRETSFYGRRENTLYRNPHIVRGEAGNIFFFLSYYYCIAFGEHTAFLILLTRCRTRLSDTLLLATCIDDTSTVTRFINYLLPHLFWNPWLRFV